MSKANASGPKALKKAAAALSERELRALIAYVRTRTVEKLIAQAAPKAKPKPAKRAPPRDGLVAEVTALLKPILAPGAEKAELLLAYMGMPDARAAGIAAAVRTLRIRFSDPEIKAGAEVLIAGLAKMRSMRETVT
jgi:hypothetical protein